MCNRLKTEKVDYEFEGESWHGTIAKIVSVDEDEVSELPLLVELECSCIDEDCQTCVDAQITIKSSVEDYNKINNVCKDHKEIEFEDILCPVCGAEMVITDINIMASDDSTDGVNDWY
jgi:hypothetical protein